MPTAANSTSAMFAPQAMRSCTGQGAGAGAGVEMAICGVGSSAGVVSCGAAGAAEWLAFCAPAAPAPAGRAPAGWAPKPEVGVVGLGAAGRGLAGTACPAPVGFAPAGVCAQTAGIHTAALAPSARIAKPFRYMAQMYHRAIAPRHGTRVAETTGP